MSDGLNNGRVGIPVYKVLGRAIRDLRTEVADHNTRIRELELAYAKAIGWCAGAAFAGAAVFQLIVHFASK